MQKANWGKFKAKFYEAEQVNFEWLCYLLFCKEFKQKNGVSRFVNHAGIETNPVVVDKEVIGWQAKFYDTPLSGHKKDFIDAITTAKARHPDLTKIIFFTNQDFGQHKKKTDPEYKKEIEAAAKKEKVKLEWRTKSYFDSEAVAETNSTLVKYFFSDSKSVIDLANDFAEHAQLILDPIQAKIDFKGQIIKIDRSDILQKIKTAMSSPLPIVLSGEGGVGKTAIIKDLLAEKSGTSTLFILKATEFNHITNINEIVSHDGVKLSELLETYSDSTDNCMVIDSAEKLADIENKDTFQALISLLIKSNWKIVFTTRLSYLEDLRFLLQEFYRINFQTIPVDNITDEQLEELAIKHSFNLPNSSRLRALIRNPFYLQEYLNNYDEFKPGTTYPTFKNILWNKKISNTSYQKDGAHIKREECFLALAYKRANEGTFFLSPDVFDLSTLQNLTADEIVGRDEASGGYFITHDIYEEWALERFVERSFNKHQNVAEFYQVLGDALPLRRAFRHWLSEKLLSSKESVEALLQNTLGNIVVAKHWQDEAIVSILLSENAERFFEFYEEQLLENNAELLRRVTFLLRIACKEVDEEYIKILRLSSTERLDLKTIYTRPKGNGWNQAIKFINQQKEKLGLKHINQTLGVLEDWVNKNRISPTTKDAGQIALFYYKEAASNGGFSYRARDLEKKVIEVILQSSLELKQELSEVIDSIIAKGSIDHRDPYYELANTILSSVLTSTQIVSAIPKKVLALAEFFWITVADEDDDLYSSSPDIEQHFGITSSHHEYFPSSPYQTPMLALLRVQPKETIDLIVKLSNSAAVNYEQSSLSKNETEQIELHLPSGINKQVISSRLWEMYRGTHVAPSLLESVYMALEKWLLEYAATVKKDELERLCLFLLGRSHSAAITAIVTSICLAHPHKLFNVAKILFGTKELFLYDSMRHQKDQRQKNSLESLETNFPGSKYEHQFFQKERAKACDDKHRQLNLEYLAFFYQFEKSEDEDDADFTEKVEEIWQILDAHYAALPDASHESEADKAWRLCLARIDRRGMTPKAEERNGQRIISFEAKIDPELRKYSEASQKKVSDALKHSALEIWSAYRWRGEHGKYEEYTQYENNPSFVIKEVKEVLDELQRKDSEDVRLLDRTAPAYACAVLVRDFKEKLKKNERQFCREVLSNYVNLLFAEGYEAHIGDGTDAAIESLPRLLDGDSSEDVQVTKALLFLTLFNDTSIGMDQYVFDHALRAVLHQLWKIDYDSAHSMLIGYLLLRPKFIALRENIRQENLKKRIYQTSWAEIATRFLEQYESDIERLVENKLEYSELPDYSKETLQVLEITFCLIPYENRNEAHQKFLTIALPIFAKKLSDGHEAGEYDLSRRFLEKYAHMILTANNDELKEYVQPFVDNFESSREIGDFLGEIIRAEDQLNSYEQFWEAWQLFYPKVVTISKEQTDHHTAKEVIYTYLLAWRYWKEGLAKWKSVKDRERNFFAKAAQDMGSHPATLYSIAKVLNDIASKFTEDGVIWLSGIIEHNTNLKTDELLTNTIYYMENVVRRYILLNRESIRKDADLKQRVLIILDFLIEKGSVIAYLTREDLL